ncbi:MAG: hypothetical protein RI997_1013, partial [Pseudomonadota bacterium]
MRAYRHHENLIRHLRQHLSPTRYHLFATH